MATLVDLYVNCDTSDSPYGTSGIDWVKMDLVNDYFVFSNGSDAVADGEPIPSASELTQASALLSGTEIIVPKYFLADISEGILKEIHNAGNQNKRYVFAFVFDGATASEPTLEIWDDSGLNSALLEVLGAGTPANSWYNGICTTGGLPGAGWVGKKLAGATADHFINLNAGNGALGAAGVCYINFKIIIPATASASGLSQPVWVVKYTE